MKKTWKRLGALFLAVAMTLTLLPTAAFALADLTQIPDTTLVSLSDMTPTGPAPYSGEELPKLKDENNSTHYGSTASFTNENDRYVQIELPNAVWLAGLYWMNRGAANGAVTKYAILASMDGIRWYPVADNREGTAWVKDNNVWNTVAFDHPVKAKYVKVLGVETQANFISCAELRLAKPTTDPDTLYRVSGTVKCGGKAVEGVNVAIAWASATTGSDGGFTVEGLVNGTYTAVVTSDNHQTKEVPVTVNNGNVTLTEDIVLEAMERTISGTVTSKGTEPLVGATVTLVGSADNHYPVVSSVKVATTGNSGEYTLNVNSVAEGEYHIRVSKDDRGALIVSDDINIAATELTETHTQNAQLPAFDDSAYEKAGYRIKTFAFEDGDENPELKNDSTAASKGTSAIADGALTLSFTTRTRADNLIKIANTPLKNGEVEFDVTRQGGNNCRFGLGLRVGAGKTTETESDFARWIFVGQFDSSHTWGYEYWNGDTASSFWSDNFTGPTFAAGETRHIKVKIENMTISLWVDGVAVFTNASLNRKNLTESAGTASFNPPTAAGDAGFLYGDAGGGGASANGDTLTIDNLRVVRFDPSFAVTLENGTDHTLTAALRVQDAVDKKLESGSKAAEGDLIVIEGTPTDENSTKALGKVTVAPSDSTNTADSFEADLQADGSFTFVMPAYAVTVTGELKETFEVSLPVDDGGNKTAPKANREYDVKLTPTIPGAEGEDKTVTATYQWYVDSGEGEGDEHVENFTAITGATGASYTPASGDVGRKLQVVVTGTELYTGIHTLTTEPVAEADAEVTSVTLDHDTIELWLDENDPNAGTATLTATVSPADATNPTIAWSSSDENVVTFVQSRENPKQVTLTAEAKGTATVTVTVTSADGETTYDASCTVTVGIKPTGVTVKNGTDVVDVDNPLLLYSNSDPITTDYDNEGNPITFTLPTSAALAFTVEPAGATTNNKITNDRKKGNYDLISRGEPGTGGYTFSVVNPGPDNVGEETFYIYYGALDDVNKVPMGEFRIVVLRYLDSVPEIVVKDGRQPRLGETLTVNPDSLDAPADKVYIYWCYQDDEGNTYYLEIEGEGDDARAVSSTEYTLKPNDVGKEIFVYVVAVEDYDTNTTEANRCYYTGETVSSTIKVLPGAAPAAPKLTATDVDGNIKGTIRITDYNVNETYQIKKTAEAWVGVEDDTQDAEVKTQTVDGKTVGVIEGLEAGTYQVRVKENDLHEAGEAGTITVGDATKTYYTVSFTEDPPEGGTVLLSDTSVEDGATVTLTVNPAVGYKIKSVKVEDSDTELEGQDETAGTVYTVEVTADTEFVVTYEKITLTISHVLDGLQCNLPDVHDGEHTVKYGEVSEITLSLTDEAEEQGLVLPDRDGITIVTVKGDVETPFTDFTYANGKITFRNGVTQDMRITARARLVTYQVSFDLTHLETDDGEPTAVPSKDYTATLSVPKADQDMWARPQTITVRRGTGTILTARTDYTYDPETGVVTIKKEAITGNLAIVAVGVLKPTEVKSVTITIGHQDAGVSSDIPHVGDVLSADVLPTGASVSYAWYVGDSEDVVATTKNYTVGSDDQGKIIKVVVTGKPDLFSGTKEATKGPVEAAVKLPTRITLDRYNYSMSVGESFTLASTIEPADDATDKTVTWSVLDVASDTVVANVATLAPRANGSVVVTAVGAGTVRIVAATSNGRTASCTLTVERANSYALNYQIVGEAASVVVRADGELVSNGGRIEAAAPVTISVTPENSEHKVTVIVMAGSTSVSAAKDPTKNEWTFNMPAENTSVSIDVGADVKPVTGVTVDPTTAEVKVGGTVDLTAAVAPADATNKNVTWISSDETIAAVGPTGIVTGVAEGTATITVTANDGGFTATCEVTVAGTVVTNVPVTGVSLNEDELALTVGETATLHYTITPSNATNQHISWDSDDTDVATVDGGVVSAVGAGTATITVTTEDGDKTATCQVTVTAGGPVTVPVGSIAVTAPNGTTIQLPEGQTTTVQLTATVEPSNATNPAVTWTTDDAAVATVDANGLVTIRSTGTVTITATSDADSSKSGSCVLTVETAPVAVTGVSLQTSSDTIKVGQAITLIPTITPASAANKGVTWESSNNTVASVAKNPDGNGVVTGLAVGTATIIVATVDGNYQATCTVEVVAADAEILVESVTVNYAGGPIALPASGTTQVTLTAEVLPSGATNKAVTWSSNNESIATVDNGVVTITGTGTVTITATSVANSTKSGTCTLTITTVRVAGVSLDKGTLDLTVGESDTLIPTVAPADASNQAVNWISSDTSVAEVDENGKVTAKAAGAATITVKTVDGEFIATCAVTVTASPVVTPPAGPIGGGILTPPTTTTVVENPDGSSTTTVTDNRTGTVTETTEKEDGTVEIVETKKDGTVTETTEMPDGSTEVVETKPDGTITATSTDPEGGKVEKITTPDEDVTITVTDKDGEELAKVEIPAEIPASPIEFVDVPEGHWAEDAINQAAGLGLVQGVGGDQFDLNGDMKRGDLALVLYNLSNGNEGYEVTFDDVPADMYYADGVAWAARTGVVNGFSETEFGPESTITREQLAVMLYRYAALLKLDTTVSGDGLDGFNDGSSIDSWAEDGMAWCVENGIIMGQGNGILAPGSNATRAEVTVMLQRFLDLMK